MENNFLPQGDPKMYIMAKNLIKIRIRGLDYRAVHMHFDNPLLLNWGFRKLICLLSIFLMNTVYIYYGLLRAKVKRMKKGRLFSIWMEQDLSDGIQMKRLLFIGSYWSNGLMNDGVKPAVAAEIEVLVILYYR